MNKPLTGPVAAGGFAGAFILALLVACIVFVVVLLLIKALWAWTVPDLLPGAVRQGLVARDISWLAAAKLALCVAVLSAIARASVPRT